MTLINSGLDPIKITSGKAKKKYTAEEVMEKLLQFHPQIKEKSKYTNPFIYDDIKKWYLELSEQAKEEYLDQFNQKEDSWDEEGHLENMDVGDWVITKKGKVVKITHDDMPDLHYSEIARFATKEEVSKAM